MVDASKLLPLFLNNCVWDIDHGLMLKLGVEREVIYAVRGYEKIGQEELLFKYGDPPTYKHLRWPVTNRQMEHTPGRHWTMMGYF
jgi:hypothetical protein